MIKTFVSAYQGSAEYLVNHIAYEVRTFADPNGSHCPDQWPTVLAEVGAVRAKHWPEMATFPPADVVALFPGFVAARVVPERGYAIEYAGSAPRTRVNDRCGWIEADPYL